MSNPRASLPGIPLELRHQIYALFFNKWFTHDLHYLGAIASVCRQIRSEALPMLLHERRCYTLEKLRTWTAKGNPDLLREITDIFLFDCHISALRYAAKEPHASLASGDDISAIIRQIFSRIPNLRHVRFNLQPYRRGPIRRQTRFPEYFLRTIATLCLKISDLNLTSDLFHVTALQGFQDVQSLEWSGLSLSTPQETLVVLNSLPYLHTIKLTRWSEYEDGATYLVSTAALHAYVSFTGYVLQNLKPLRQFQIKHRTPRLRSEFLTTEMLEALAVHRGSLVDLRLLSAHLVEGAVLDQLLNLIPSLPLERLQISFTSIPRQYKDIKPGEYVAPSVKFCHITFRVQEGTEKVDLEHHLRCGDFCSQGMLGYRST